MTALTANEPYGDRWFDAVAGAAINVCDAGEGTCKRCRGDLGTGTCLPCAVVATRAARCLYCNRRMTRGVLRECHAPHDD